MKTRHAVRLGVLLTLVSLQSWSNSGITYHGRVLKPNGTPVSSNQVQFRIQVRTPGTENCLLWEEQQTKDLSTSNGIFSVTMADTSEPTLIANTLPFTIERIFSNRTNFTSLTGCSAGSTYNPTATDGRNLQVYFRENPTDPWEQMPAIKINFVPLALNTVQLAGYLPSEFLKVDAASSYTPLTATQVNTLVDLIAGTNSQYLRPSSTFAGDVSGTASTTSVDKIKGVAISGTPTTGQVLKYDGTNWVPSTDATGGSPSDATYSVKGVVQINTDLATSGLYIASGVLALPNLVTAGSVGSASSVPVLTYDAKGRLTAVSSATVDDTTKLPLAGGTMTGSINMGSGNITNATSMAATNASVRNLILNDTGSNTVTVKAPTTVTSSYTLNLPTTAGTSGYVLSTDGSGNLSWISQPSGSLALSDYAADLTPAASCTTSQTPYWSTVSDTWACQNINVTTAGGFFKDGGNSLGADASLGTNDNFKLSLKTNNTTAMTIDTSGKVGIGITAPVSLLDVYGYTSSTTSVQDVAFKAYNTIDPTSNSSAFPLAADIRMNSQSGNSSNLTNAYMAGLQAQTNHFGTGVWTGGPTSSAAVAAAAQNRSTGTMTHAPALSGMIRNHTTGTITNAYGVVTSITNSSTGTINNAYGLLAKSPANTSGVMTNYYGVYIESPTSATNNYALYSAGGTNYFAGNVGIGSAAPSVSLDLGSKTDAIRMPAAGDEGC